MGLVSQDNCVYTRNQTNNWKLIYTLLLLWRVLGVEISQIISIEEAVNQSIRYDSASSADLSE